jgi:hypothetical protein
MAPADRFWTRAARRYESMRRPQWVLVGLILLLYAPSLTGPFCIDDHHALRVMSEYAGGSRSSPDVYRFLSGDPEKNRAARQAGWFPWWMEDSLRYQHFRPLAQWALYGQFRLFGDHPAGYRAVSLALYLAGTLLAFQFLRRFTLDERLSRWGAVIFAVATPHAVPVMFISAQGDVIALICATGTLLLIAGFMERGGASRLAGGLAALAVGLFVKEAMFAVALVPFLILIDRRPRLAVRHFAAMAATTAVALAWLRIYLSDDYGSNTSMMLDPIGDAGDYLLRAPLRALVLLSTWLLPINPFIFELRPFLHVYALIYALLGAGALLAVTVVLARRHRGRRGVRFAALWVLAFLPILVCTPPDDRIMALPSVGLALLGAAWMTRQRADGTRRLGRVPILLFIVIPMTAVIVTDRLLRIMERTACDRLRAMAESFDGCVEGQRMAYVLNCPFAFDGLFMQDRLGTMEATALALAVPLSDVDDVTATVVDDHTLRLAATGDPLLSSFLGRMGSVRGGRRAVGDEYDCGQYRARIDEVDTDGVAAVTIRFVRPLNDPCHRFFTIRTGRDGGVQRVRFDHAAAVGTGPG